MSSQSLAVTAILIMVIAAIVGAGGLVGTAQAATLVVDDDGTDCPWAGHTSITSAVASASSFDTIQVCSGTYNESVDIDVENIRLIADGSAVLDANATKGVAFHVNADDVWIEGFEMQNYTSHVIRVHNEGPFSGYHRTTITNNVIWISGPGAHRSTRGIHFKGRKSNDISVTNNLILDAPGGPSRRGMGVYVGSMGTCSTCNRNAVIENNTITARNQGIFLGGGAPGSVVRNNTVTVHRDYQGGGRGIRVHWVRSVEVSGNDVTVLDSDIVGIVGSVEKAGNLTIEKNAIDGGKHGVVVQVFGSQTTSNPNRPVVVRSNEISNTADDGIRVIDVDSTRVVDNVVTDPEDKGIVLADADDLEATGNRIAGAVNGIRLQDSQGTAIDDNWLDGNDIGLNFRPGTGLAAARGNIVTNGATGIRVEGIADSRFRNNSVSNSTSEVVRWVGSTPNTTVTNLTLDSATVSFEAQNIRLSGLDSPPDDPAIRGNVDAYVAATEIDSEPTPWLDLNVSYTEAAAVDLNESTFELWRNNGSSWSSVPGSTVDTEANHVSANVTSFSVFAPLALPNDSTPPQLIGSTPSDDALDVSLDTDLTLQFDETVQVGNGQLYLNATADDRVLDGVPIGSATVSIDGGNVTWGRSSDLPVGTEVYLYVSNGVIFDNLGNAWPGTQDNSTINFTTRPDMPPQLISSSPADGATDVQSNTDVTLRFDETVQAGTGQLHLNRTTDGAVLDSVAIGSSDVTFDGVNVTWTRSSNLPPGTDVYLYVPSGVIQDGPGNAWAGIQDPTTLNFATGTGDWSTFGYDTRNSGYNPHATGPESDVTELWNFTAGSSVRSSPTVVNDTVYVGSDDDSVYALNAADGSVEWDFRTGKGVLSSPAVVEDTVYVGSVDWEVYALNATDGAKRWNFTAVPTTSSPAVVDNTVYIIASRTLYALNGTDGTERWNYSISLGQRMSPAVAEDTVFLGDGNGIVYALNATDGTKRWDFDTGDGVRSSPAVVDDTVYVGNRAGEVYALNATSGTKRWNFTTGNEVFASPAVADGVVYVGSFDRNVYALNASDGTKRWNFTTGSIVASSAAVANGTVYVGSNDHNMYGLNATDGTERWNFTTGFQVISSPAVVDGVVYVGSSDNKVYALREEKADNTPPEITNLSVQVIDTRTIFVSLDSNESLGTIEVEVENQAGTVEETLTAADFGSFGTDPAEYFAQTNLPSAGTYTVTLTTAADATGNDGASGENATVELVVEDVSIEHVNGTAPHDLANLSSNVYLSQGPGGLLQVQLRDESDPTADVANRTDLENLGVESDTTLAINVTLLDWTPRLLLGTGHDLSWTTTDLGANVTALNLTVQPAETQLIESQLLNPDQPWPTGANDRADVRMNATVDLAVDDMEHLADPGQRDAVDGTILATDAQAFGTPRYDAETNTLSLFVAGPHMTVDGENHTGFYDAFLPDALLDEWGVEDASELAVAYQGDPIDFAAQNVDGGIELAIDLTYSAGDVAISAPDAESDTAPEPEPEPEPPSASDPDPESEPDDEPEQTKTVEVDDTEDNVTVRKTVATGNASANTTVALDVSVEPEDDPENATEEHPVTLDRLNVTMNRTADVSLTITESAEPPTEDSATFERTDGTQLLGYIRIDHELEDEAVGEVELEFRVRKALLDEAGDDPEHVALYRLEGDEWAELPTDLVGETDTHYVFLAISPGLSEFATGAKRAKFEIANAQVSVTELHTGDDFEVLVRITNTGGVDGTYTTELWIDGDLMADQDVTVAANGTRQVTFDHDFETPGSYEVRVNDLSTGQIHVLAVTPTAANPTTAPAGTEASPPEGGSTVSLPGFGMAVALVAVLIVSLLAGRRRD